MPLLDITNVSEAATTPLASSNKPNRQKIDPTVQDVPVSAEATDASETTASIVQHLLAQGLRMEDIIMPGSAKDAGIYVADDFDAPCEDFEDYQ